MHARLIVPKPARLKRFHPRFALYVLLPVLLFAAREFALPNTFRLQQAHRRDTCSP
jgi:hypothetical protein